MYLYRPIIHRRPALLLPNSQPSILLLFAFKRRNAPFEQCDLLLLLLELESLLLDFFVGNTLFVFDVMRSVGEAGTIMLRCTTLSASRSTHEVLQRIAVLVSGHDVLERLSHYRSTISTVGEKKLMMMVVRGEVCPSRCCLLCMMVFY
jgi:hypothetical protein